MLNLVTLVQDSFLAFQSVNAIMYFQIAVIFFSRTVNNTCLKMKLVNV
jgi:hypothetical protein